MGFHTLGIGRTALITSQYAMNVTGNNIANAATDGYSRQLIGNASIAPSGWGVAATGLGVELQSVRRVSDNYLEMQMRNAYSHGEYLSAMNTCYYNMEVYFAIGTKGTIASALDGFFDSVSDWNDQVENMSMRTQVIESGKSLAERFNQVGGNLYEYRVRCNDEVVGMVDEVNNLIKSVAEYNTAIVRTESGGATGVVANDLRDKRDTALKNLAGLIDIQTTEESNGSVIVRAGSRNLVYNNQTQLFTTRQKMSGDLLVDVPCWADDGSPVSLHDGKLGAMLEIRDEILAGYIKDVDHLAQTIIWEVNRAHSQSSGMVPLDRVVAGYAPYETAAYLDELPYSFRYPSDVFRIRNGTMEIIIHDTASETEKTVPVEIDLDRRTDPTGERDTILWDPDEPDAENSLVNVIQRALDAAQPGAFKVGVDSANRFYMESLSDGFGFSFGEDTSGVLAALGINSLFTGHNAMTMGANPAVDGKPSLLAGARATASTNAFVSGNNNGAQALLDLRNQSLFNADSTTIDGYYQAITGRLGVEGQRVLTESSAQISILTRVTNAREELSGVSLDEELTKLIQYQRTFQSASKFISITDQLYETLINM